MRRRKKPPCPVCGSKKVVPIVYGHPLAEDIVNAEAGRVVLGGFCIHEESPDWACTDCQHTWR